MIYVYSETEGDADRWARGQELRPRDFRTVGNRSRWVDGLRLVADDRIVIVGMIDHKVEAALQRNLRKTQESSRPEIERVHYMRR